METESQTQVDNSILNRSQEIMTVKEAGRRGGLATLAKHGESHFRKAGSIGGKTTNSRHRNKLKKWGCKGGNSRKYRNCTPVTITQNSKSNNTNEIQLPDNQYVSQPITFILENTVRQKAGKKGGLSTFTRYGRSHMSFIGKLGGRPTFQETIERTRTAHINSSGRVGKKEVLGHRLNSAAIGRSTNY